MPVRLQSDSAYLDGRGGRVKILVLLHIYTHIHTYIHTHVRSLRAAILNSSICIVSAQMALVSWRHS